MDELTDQQYKRIFRAMPGKIVVLDPIRFRVLAATDAFLDTMSMTESEILHKRLHDVFPDTTGNPSADWKKCLSASLTQVKLLKIADMMQIVSFPVRRPNGKLEERFWSSINTPVLNDAGDIDYIMHRLEDVTSVLDSGSKKKSSRAIQNLDPLALQELIQRSNELGLALSELQKHRIRSQTAERLLNLGSWDYDVETGHLNWSNQVFEIYGCQQSDAAPDFDKYFARVHPEEREAAREHYLAFAEGRSNQIIFQHRVIGGDGNVKHIKGVGERHISNEREIVVGYVQDISSIRAAQMRADEAERQRLGVLQSISDAFFALDDDWRFTFLNHQASVLLQRSVHDLLGKVIWTEFPEAQGSAFEEEYRRAVELRETRRFQAFYPPLGNWFDVSVYPMNPGLSVYFRDVTKERHNQEHLRLVDAALSRQNDIVMITTAENLNAPSGPEIVYVNDAFESLTGFSRSEAIGKTPRILQGPGTDRRVLDEIRTALESYNSVRCELLNYSKSGNSYWLELDITPLFDDEGQCTHYVAVERDITQRKLQEVQLQQARERFELISRATNDVIWDWDLASNLVWWNGSLTEAFGYANNELEPGPESRLNRIHPDDRDRVLDKMHRVMNGLAQYWQDEYRFIKRDGSSAYVIDRGFVLRDDTGKPTRMLGSILDITDRREIEERLRESQKMEAVGHLTGGVAHDFNNLLTVIVGNAEMMAKKAIDQQTEKMAAMTLKAARRGAELTSRLLAFARRQPLEPRHVNINEMLYSTKELFQRTLPASIEIEYFPHPQLDIVEVDVGELDSALLNLVINARDAMADGGKLTIETANVVLDRHYSSHHAGVTPGEYVMVAVSDTGTGMNEATVRRSIEPFFTTKASGKGSGLGLSMVFGFTKQSGGHVNIYSELGTGTTVKLYFPKSEGSRFCHLRTSNSAELIGGSERILVAEDDDLVRTHLVSQLRDLGYEVTAVESGPEAIQILNKNAQFDMLMTDIIMPGGINGRQLAEKAGSICPTMKVLYTSGYTENAIVHHGRLDPGIDFLRKPYSQHELASKVRKVLDNSQKPAKNYENNKNDPI